ncbi:uncharacterized protein HD556DRAFT_1313418 [Suillus plorans]|uniref:Secreted protein n=1 Tax=Suillus plorans TaxID=116603 RepID=A0A9P7ACI0_9AGAM|nr:uncharacterized protein HD556DRAFT_1313418 [Suillus plorans]KAG1786535.1 hypothetical protein HD556DRAFT_1313418 [Suillus plorans]
MLTLLSPLPLLLSLLHPLSSLPSPLPLLSPRLSKLLFLLLLQQMLLLFKTHVGDNFLLDTEPMQLVLVQMRVKSSTWTIFQGMKRNRAIFLHPPLWHLQALIQAHSRLSPAPSTQTLW